LVLAGLLTACAPPLDNGAQGVLRIILAGGVSSGARAISPEIEAGLSYRLEFSGPGEEAPRVLEPGTGTLTLPLILGEWIIRAKAYQGEVLYGSGEIPVTVEAGRINDARIVMKTALAAITAFSFADPPATGILDGESKTIAVTVPFGTDVTNLIPTVTHLGARVSPASGEAQDFSEPVVYTVTAANGDEAEWTVTVTIFGFTIEGPGDLMVPVSITHSAGSVSSTAISWSGDESLTFTVDTAYSAEAGNLQWLVNGETVAAPGNSLTVRSRDYILRTYTLTVMIKEQGQWYSGNYDFTVVR
jgi:hypothetical protein